MRTAGEHGLPAASPEVDLSPVLERIRSVIRHIYDAESPDVLAAEGMKVVTGEASFSGPGTLVVNGRELMARRFLVCTGASPAVPSIAGLDGVEFLTYETVWDLEELPASLAVIGAGSVGCELAQAFARLGSKVTIIEAANRVLPAEDPEVSDVIARRLTHEGIQLLVNRTAEAVSRAGESDHGIGIDLSGGGRVQAEHLLLAVGRRPNADGLGLDAAGVRHGPAGIQVDRYLRTTAKGIYAAGDVTGGPQFTHYAGWQGFMAVRNAFLPLNTVAVRHSVPRAIFTDPEAAQAGMTEDEARAQFGGKATVSRWPMSEVDRALTDREADGFVKAIHLPNGRILGATIAAPRAGEMIQEWTMAIDHGMKLGDMARSIHVYPTYSMASQQLALKAQSERLLGGRAGGLLRRLARRG